MLHKIGGATVVVDALHHTRLFIKHGVALTGCNATPCLMKSLICTTWGFSNLAMGLFSLGQPDHTPPGMMSFPAVLMCSAYYTEAAGASGMVLRASDVT